MTLYIVYMSFRSLYLDVEFFNDIVFVVNWLWVQFSVSEQSSVFGGQWAVGSDSGVERNNEDLGVILYCTIHS